MAVVQTHAKILIGYSNDGTHFSLKPQTETEKEVGGETLQQY